MHSKRVALVLILFIILFSYSVGAVRVQYNAVSDDGYLSNSNAVYTVARDSMDADTIETSGFIKIGQTSGAEWTVSRGYLYFDTSGIPDDARVQKAWLYFYVVNNPISIRVLSDFGLATPASPLTKDCFHIANYDLKGPPYLISSTGWNNILIVDNLIDEGVPVSNTGITKFAIVSESDYQINAHNTGLMNIHSEDNANKPYLLVQYNTPPSTPVLEGGAKGSIQTTYRLSMTSTDDDTESQNNKIRYKIEWGDGQVSWAPGHYAESGETVTTTHRYAQVGNHTIRVTAYDNSGELNDHSGVAVKNVEIGEGPLPGEQPEGIIGRISSWFWGFFPTREDDPNPAFNSLKAKYFKDDAGQRHLAIWWDVNRAAFEQNNLMVNLQIETVSGTTELGSFNVRDHTTFDTAYVVLNWDQKFTGHETWSFTIRASFLNPTNIPGEPADHQQIALMFLLGLAINVRNIILLIFAIVLIILILLIYKYRKTIFWKRYLPHRTQIELDKMEEGYWKDWILERQRKQKEKEQKKKIKKKKSIIDTLLKDIKDWRKKTEPVKSTSTGQPTTEKYTTKTEPVQRKEKTRKEKKEIEKTKRKQVKRKDDEVEIKALNFKDIATNPEIKISEKDIQKKKQKKENELYNLKKEVGKLNRIPEKKYKEMNKLDKDIKKLIRIQEINRKKKVLIDVATSKKNLKEKMQRLRTAGMMNESSNLEFLMKDVLKGNVSEEYAEREIARLFNNLNNEMSKKLTQTGHRLHVKPPSKQQRQRFKTNHPENYKVAVTAEVPKRPLTEYNLHIKHEMKKGKTFKQAVESWNEKQKFEKLYGKNYNKKIPTKKKQLSNKQKMKEQGYVSIYDDIETAKLIKKLESEGKEDVKNIEALKRDVLKKAKFDGKDTSYLDKIKENYNNRIERAKHKTYFAIETLKKNRGYEYDKDIDEEVEETRHQRRKRNKKKYNINKNIKQNNLKKIGIKNKKNFNRIKGKKR